MSDYNWKFEWLTEWNGIWNPDFLTEWQTWMAVSPDAHVFFDPSIVRAWVMTYDKLQIIRPQLLIARSDLGRIVFLPLVYVKNNWKNAWLRVIQPVGYSDFDYHDPIVVNDSLAPGINFWEYFFKELTTRWKGTFDIAIINGLRNSPFTLPAKN